MVKGRIAVLYFLLITIPLFLFVQSWQSSRYAALEREGRQNETRQKELIDANRRLIADIALLSSSARIENLARDTLGLEKKQPEEVLLIDITGGDL